MRIADLKHTMRDGVLPYLRTIAVRVPLLPGMLAWLAARGPSASRIRLLELQVARLERDNRLMAAQISAITDAAAHSHADPDADARAAAIQAAWGSAVAAYEQRIAALERRR